VKKNSQSGVPAFVLLRGRSGDELHVLELWVGNEEFFYEPSGIYGGGCYESRLEVELPEERPEEDTFLCVVAKKVAPVLTRVSFAWVPEGGKSGAETLTWKKETVLRSVNGGSCKGSYLKPARSV